MTQELIVAFRDPHYLNYAISVCGNKTDGEELVQEAFCRMLTTEPSGPLKPYILTMIRNLWYDNGRAHRVSKSVSIDQPVETLNGEESYAELLADGAAALEDQLIVAENISALYEGMDQLKRSYRTVLSRADLKEQKLEDIAKDLGIPCGSVKSRLSHARRKLAKVMEER